MERRSIIPILLIVVGLVGVLFTAYSRVLSTPPDIFVTILTSIISIGLIIAGTAQRSDGLRSQDVVNHLPGRIVATIGLISIVGGLFVYRPWLSGITIGFRIILTIGVGLLGTILLVIGLNWSRNNEIRYPLGLLIAGLVFGLSYIANDRFDIFFSNIIIVSTMIVAIAALKITIYSTPNNS